MPIQILSNNKMEQLETIYIRHRAIRRSALARTLQLFTDRPNNHSRSREFGTFLYNAAETVTKFFPRTMFDGLLWKF